MSLDQPPLTLVFADPSEFSRDRLLRLPPHKKIEIVFDISKMQEIIFTV